MTATARQRSDGRTDGIGEVDPLAPRRDADAAPALDGPAGRPRRRRRGRVRRDADRRDRRRHLADRRRRQRVHRPHAEVAEGLGDRAVRDERQARAASRDLDHAGARRARRRPARAPPAVGRRPAGIAAFGVVGAVVAAGRPSESIGAAVPALARRSRRRLADLDPDRDVRAGDGATADARPLPRTARVGPAPLPRRVRDGGGRRSGRRRRRRPSRGASPRPAPRRCARLAASGRDADADRRPPVHDRPRHADRHARRRPTRRARLRPRPASRSRSGRAAQPDSRRSSRRTTTST